MSNGEWEHSIAGNKAANAVIFMANGRYGKARARLADAYNTLIRLLSDSTTRTSGM